MVNYVRSKLVDPFDYSVWCRIPDVPPQQVDCLNELVRGVGMPAAVCGAYHRIALAK
jgi:hypothetical protein